MKKNNISILTNEKIKMQTAKLLAHQQNQLIGKWRIIEMEQWNQDFIDAEMQGYIEFLENSTGEFHFGYVHGYVNCQYADNRAVKFSWEGNDEMDEAWGNGDAVIENKMLLGNLIFHNGDESWFKAVPFTK